MIVAIVIRELFDAVSVDFLRIPKIKDSKYVTNL